MSDLLYPIRMRYFTLQGLNKSEMRNICIENNYLGVDTIYNKVQIIHFILKKDYPADFDDFINFREVDKIELNDRVEELKRMNIAHLKTILKNYRLTQNGYKSYLVERIIKYEFYNKIITNEEQKNLKYYKELNNIKFIPEINYINSNYHNDYDITSLYRPVEFYNIDEYIKHMENLRLLNNNDLILEHLESIPPTYINYICYNLNQQGWVFEDYDTTITNTVNEKYSEKEENNDIINNIPSFLFNINNNEVNNETPCNCIVCICDIEDNDECKKLDCGHMFHIGCIDNWLRRTLECPMCRNVIT